MTTIGEYPVGSVVSMNDSGQSDDFGVVIRHGNPILNTDSVLVGWKSKPLFTICWEVADAMLVYFELFPPGYTYGYWFLKTDKVYKIATTEAKSVVSSNGMQCKVCREFNSYGQANMSDGSYCCYSCRR